MGVSRHLQLLLGDLQVSEARHKDGGDFREARVFKAEPADFNNEQMGAASEPGTPKSSATLPSSDAWEDSSGPTGSDITRGIFHDGFAKMVEQLGQSHVRVAGLEAEVNSLKEEKLKQEFQHNLYVQSSKTMLARMASDKHDGAS